MTGIDDDDDDDASCLNKCRKFPCCLNM